MDYSHDRDFSMVGGGVERAGGHRSLHIAPDVTSISPRATRRHGQLASTRAELGVIFCRLSAVWRRIERSLKMADSSTAHIRVVHQRCT
jgi:hypothetical protein